MAEIFVISGFSGVGKSSLCEDVLKKIKGVECVKSYTTRPARKSEENYTFVSEETFSQMEIEGEFLETNTYNRNRYGTPRREVEQLLQEGKNIILEIDVQGYKQILVSGLGSRANIHGAFIVADAQDIYNRLKDRGTEDLNKIIERMETAIAEAKEVGLYDVIIENSDFKIAASKLEKFLSERKLERSLFDVDNFVKEAEGIIRQQRMFRDSSIEPGDYKSAREYIDEKENVKMAEQILHTYKIGDVLTRNEYAVLIQYFEKQKNYRAELEILGAEFVNNLQSMSNYGTQFAICSLLQISEVLIKTKHLHNAEKVLSYAEHWIMEDELADDRINASIKLLRKHINEVKENYES